MVFYAALLFRIRSLPSNTSLKVPIVDLELSGPVVLASGSAVMSFLMLAIIGTLRAVGRAREKLGLSAGGDWSGEQFDVHPNAIDLAFDTTPQSPKIIASVAYFAYPVFLLVGLVEAAWLWWHLVDARAPAWCVFAVAGALLWLPAMWQVASMCCRRIGNLSKLWNTK